TVSGSGVGGVRAIAGRAGPRTSSPHHAHSVDHPTVLAAQLQQRPGGALRRISRAIGPRIAPRTAHHSGFRRRWAATYAAAAPNPMSHARIATWSNVSMERLGIRNGQIPGTAPRAVQSASIRYGMSQSRAADGSGSGA